jgi:molecular chaperone GrpE
MQDHNGNGESAGNPPTPANDAARPLLREQDLPALLAAKEAEFADFKESAMRQLAEMQNLRRRADNEAAEAKRFGAVPLARDILAVADNLQRALEAARAIGQTEPRDPRFDALRQGVEMTERELQNVLERHGVHRHDPMGQRFDPNSHQAMFEVESADAAPGTVVQVIQVGYTIHDRLLRPALVGVAKATPDGSADPDHQRGDDGAAAAPR